MSMGSLTKYILDLNRQRSKEFCSPAMQDWLQLYQKHHPTSILAFKCMDGRLNLPVIANMPTGIIQPFRNIGGKFNLGSPYLGRLVLDAKERALSEGHRMLALCTYHFSKDDIYRGCAGHDHDIEAAKSGARDLELQFERIFGKRNPVVSAIVIGIETDEDAIIFHNGNEEQFSIADHEDAADEKIKELLFSLYKSIPEEILNDLLPIALGNRDHVRDIRLQKRPIAELVHGENIICVGRGFGWLHIPNKALIIGPYDYAWGDAVQVAGKIVSTNISDGRVPKEDGALLLVVSPYWSLEESGLAKEKSRYLLDIAEKEIRTSFPDLKFEILVGIVDMQTRLFHQIIR